MIGIVNLFRRHMKPVYSGKISSFVILVFLTGFLIALAGVRPSQGSSVSQFAGTSSLPASDLIQPEALAAALKTGAAPKPLILHVGFRVLYTQAHIPGSEFVGPGNRPDGITLLRRRVESLPRTQSIVIYCGCCPWNECPNLGPAYRELRALGFRNVKVLYIAQNFGRNWADRGFPIEAGR
jgi:thiosulfate/3-mercaptopyruvate sulfurtransferase